MEFKRKEDRGLSETNLCKENPIHVNENCVWDRIAGKCVEWYRFRPEQRLSKI